MCEYLNVCRSLGGFYIVFQIFRIEFVEVLLCVDYYLKFENKCLDVKSKLFIFNEICQIEYMMFNKLVCKSY